MSKILVCNPVFLVGAFMAAAGTGMMAASMLAAISFPASDDAAHIRSVRAQCAAQYDAAAVEGCIEARQKYEKEVLWPSMKAIGFTGALGGMIGGGIALSAMSVRRSPRP